MKKHQRERYEKLEFIMKMMILVLSFEGWIEDELLPKGWKDKAQARAGGALDDSVPKGWKPRFFMCVIYVEGLLTEIVIW
jgi:hypothetical protein